MQLQHQCLCHCAVIWNTSRDWIIHPLGQHPILVASIDMPLEHSRESMHGLGIILHCAATYLQTELKKTQPIHQHGALLSKITNSYTECTECHCTLISFLMGHPQKTSPLYSNITKWLILHKEALYLDIILHIIHKDTSLLYSHIRNNPAQCAATLPLFHSSWIIHRTSLVNWLGKFMWIFGHIPGEIHNPFPTLPLVYSVNFWNHPRNFTNNFWNHPQNFRVIFEITPEIFR